MRARAHAQELEQGAEASCPLCRTNWWPDNHGIPEDMIPRYQLWQHYARMRPDLFFDDDDSESLQSDSDAD